MDNTIFSLENKTILVTGASSGIGREIAIACSNFGAKVLILGRNIERLKQTLSLLVGDGHSYHSLDLNDDKLVLEFCNSSIEIDGLVHSAGIVKSQLFSFLKEESFRHILDTNLVAPVMLTKHLLKKKKINKESSIVFLSSISGPVVTYIGNSAYSASKSALCGIAKTMALELASKGIRVNTIMPAMIETELISSIDSSKEDIELDKKNYPLGDYGKPEDVAFSVIFLLSKASKWMTGTDLKLDGGLTLK
ncbi:3-oxoacyl-ACP reductase [Nonlabens sp. YIK11]|uniref:SDR family NAD(P)-dependent oxidoreductase n=1 Tax=Nonlabens sp. YIK11 TaxID=1453349 RepID=UPI0006DD271E|nr:SDR family oxidoreductase [Nonlabens sp. YIK11]KQC34056.1 3-oxoacyl-ACP reductase [Nonlabens sp. YIK11]